MNLEDIPLPPGWMALPGDDDEEPPTFLDSRIIIVQCYSYSKQVDDLRGATGWLVSPVPVRQLPEASPVAQKAVDALIDFVREKQRQVRAVQCSACGKAEDPTGTRLPTQKVLANLKTRGNANLNCFDDTFMHLEYPVCHASPTCSAKVLKMLEKQMSKMSAQMGLAGRTVSLFPCSFPECGRKHLDKGKLKRCSACKSSWYCNAECQKKDWPRHKSLCASKSGKG